MCRAYRKKKPKAKQKQKTLETEPNIPHGSPESFIWSLGSEGLSASFRVGFFHLHFSNYSRCYVSKPGLQSKVSFPWLSLRDLV